MRTCICQIIKDELDYIEEWVEYNHNLGIDHIYLIEDFDSKSHKDILNKYNYVDLYKLEDILDEYEYEYAYYVFEFRQRVIYHIFCRLWRDKYDWLFFIDPDEYINCDKKHLFEVLNDNINKPVISMKWVMMKCDGYIYHPNNHQKYSLIDTYKTYTNKYSHTKQIINCNSELTIYDNFTYLPHAFNFGNNICDITIKHFTFKSFEEHVNRLSNRGEMTNSVHYRKLEDFFKVNDDIDKDKILKEFNIDINKFNTKLNVDYFHSKEYNVNNLSITNNQCNILNNFLNLYKPNNIIEFGCGVTTNIFLEYVKENNNINFTSIEHNVKYIKHDNTKIFDFTEHSNLYIDKDHKYLDVNKYIGLEKYLKNIDIKFDFICIDGPYSFNNIYKYCRIQLLDFVLYDLIDDFCIFMIHDTERKSIQNTISIFEKELYRHDFKYIKYNDFFREKQMTIYKIYKNNL